MATTLLTASASAASAAAAYCLYRTARPWFRVRVNCWFCQTDSRVDHAARHGWVCGACDQYNGFADDGDYNREVDGMRCGDDDPVPIRYAPAGGQQARDNGLCKNCSLNQSLQVHQLAKFVPREEERFDEEVEEFSAHLERTYRLCRRCEAIVHQTLGEQDSWLKPKLLSWRLELNRQTALRSAQILRQSLDLRREGLPSRFFIVVLAVLSFLHALHLPHHEDCLPQEGGQGEEVGPHNATTLPSPFTVPLPSVLAVAAGSVQSTFGLLELVCTAVLVTLISNLSPRRRKVWDGPGLLHLASWSFLLIMCGAVRFFDDARYLATNVIPVFTVIVLLHAIWNVLSVGQHRRRKSPTEKSFRYGPNYSTVENNEDSEATVTQDLVSTVPSLNQSWCSRSSDRSHLITPSFSQSGGSRLEREAAAAGCDISSLSIDGDSSSSSGGGSIDLDRDRPPSAATKFATAVGAFNIKPYSGRNSSGIDFGGERMTRRKFVLRPPKFNPTKSGVVKTSWVAGGYWESKRRGCETGQDSISRASSQSSGFVSNGSANVNVHDALPYQLDLPPSFHQNGISLPNSRVNSTAADRHSVLSEPAYRVAASANASFNLNRMSGELLNFSTAKAARTKSRSSDSSFDSSLDRMTQEAFAELKPKAKSSPIVPKEAGSLLERQISLNCSLYSVLLSMSVVFNVCLGAYVVFVYV